MLITGRNALLLAALEKTKVGLHDEVPTFGGVWLPEPDVVGHWSVGFEI